MNKEADSSLQGPAPRDKKRKKRAWWIALAIVAALVVIGLALYQVPAIHDRAYYHLTTLRSRIYYTFRPPEESEFQPSSDSTLDLSALAATASPTPTIQPATGTAQQETPQPTATLQPTAVATPLPEAVYLEGIKQEYQRFNSCGPTNLAFALRYWGWVGDPIDIEAVLKPRLEDRNVTPVEMMTYIQDHTELGAVLRYNGNIELLKRFVAAGFPVLVERGYVNRDDGWMGHYGVIDGYDDSVVLGGKYDNVIGLSETPGAVHIPDSFNGNIWVTYDSLQSYWDEFSGIYLVVFPKDRESEVMTLLGPDADPEFNLNQAISTVSARLESVEQSQRYFTLYSLGELLVLKQDYANAAAAFDEAFSVYGYLPPEDRPWRMLWYQVGPYEAYYQMGRYDDVVSLAYKTITDTPQPALPETFLWSGRANVALGNTSSAIFDFKRALQWHPGWPPAVQELEALGVDPQS